jgi:hypothetical protein
MKEMGKEQAILIAEQMQRQEREERIAREKKRRRINHIKCNIWKYSVSTIFILYISWLMWAVVQIRIEERPELGRCLFPKGTWIYQHYNNLKWIDCEIK